VTASKIADGSVTASKIADGSVTTAKIADGNVTTAKIADGNVTTAKIADAAITAAKIAAGVVPQIGITVTLGLSNGQTIPIPSGFARQDCVYLVSLKHIDLGKAAGQIINVLVDANGVVSTSVPDAVTVMAAAFAKRGGW